MKIIYINNLYPPIAVGGAEKVVTDLAQANVETGNETVVITAIPWSGWGSWRPKITVEDKIKVYRFWAPNIFFYKKLAQHNWLLKLLWHKIDIYNVFSTLIVKHILLLEKPEIVNTHNLMGLGFGILKVIQKLKIIHRHTLHDVQLVEPSGILPWNHEQDYWWQKIYQKIMKMRFGKPDEVVSPSEFLKKFYQERNFFGESKWAVTSSILLRLRATADEEDQRSRMVIGCGLRVTDRKIFLFVGSLVKHKGVEVLMQAWDKLPKDLAIELRIVGDGIEREKIQIWAKKDGRIKIYGRQAGEELNKIYQTSEVLIFPSICLENRPQVIEEAKQSGLFIIAADTGGVGEMLVDYENSKLVRPGDEEELNAEFFRLSI